MQQFTESIKTDLGLLGYEYEVVELGGTHLKFKEDIKEKIIFVLTEKGFANLNINETNEAKKVIKIGNSYIVNIEDVYSTPDVSWVLEAICSDEELKNFMKKIY